uniref:Uncharacterized protein n=1 Tax=Anguilla anguilla TaxID=7936 RepID=A0A0E9UDY2_ANGAN
MTSFNMREYLQYLPGLKQGLFFKRLLYTLKN